MFEGPEKLAVQFAAFNLLHEHLRCEMGGIAPKVVGSPVDGAEKLPFEVVVGVNGLLGTHVYVPEILAGQIRADGQADEVDGTEPVADFFEAGKVAGVPSEEEIILIGSSDPAAPESAAMIDKTSVRVMLGRSTGKLDTTVREGVPPVELMIGGDTYALEFGTKPEGHNEHRVAGQPLDRRLVEVVVVVVGQKHHIDRRQILESDTSLNVAAGTEKRQRRYTVAPDGIGKDVQTAKLDEEG